MEKIPEPANERDPEMGFLIDGLHLDVERNGSRIIVHGPQDTEFVFGNNGKGDVTLTSQPTRNPLSQTEMGAVFQKAREALLASNRHE